MLFAPMPVWTCRKCLWLLLTVLCVCVCVLFCMSEEMRPMKLFVLGFRVVAHISMLPVRGAHASVFPHPLFSFCVLIVTFPPGVIRMNL